MTQPTELEKARSIASDIEYQLKTGSVWYDRDSVHRHDGLIRAMRKAGPDRRMFAEAVLALLPSPDVELRTGAVAALGEVLPELGRGRVAAALRDAAPLLKGVRPAWDIGCADLGQAAEAVVGHSLSRGP